MQLCSPWFPSSKSREAGAISSQKAKIMYNPLDEKWLYDGDLPVEPDGFSLEFCRMSPEEQAQVIGEVADDLEKNYTVVIEDGHAVLKERGA